MMKGGELVPSSFSVAGGWGEANDGGMGEAYY